MSFADTIGLSPTWPRETEANEMSPSGQVEWAQSYLSAAEALYLPNSASYDYSHYAGPVVHMVGLATELTLKALLKGAGEPENSVRKLGHNTYDAYLAAKIYFDEVKFLQLVFSNTEHLRLPKEIEERIVERSGSSDATTEWRVFFNHLRILDQTYDRPYLTRYIKSGSIVLPDAYILLAGSKILISAMMEKL